MENKQDETNSQGSRNEDQEEYHDPDRILDEEADMRSQEDLLHKFQDNGEEIDIDIDLPTKLDDP